MRVCACIFKISACVRVRACVCLRACYEGFECGMYVHSCVCM